MKCKHFPNSDGDCLVCELEAAAKDEFVQHPNLELVTVPRDLYYHEVAYVRGLEEKAKTLAALNMEFQHALRAAAIDIDKLTTALRRIKSLDPKNVEKYAQEIAREAIDERKAK